MNPATEHLEDKLLDYAYGELSESEARTVEAHLRSCAKCADSLSAMSQVRRSMSRLPIASPPAAGLESLIAYAEKAAQAARAKPRRTPAWVRWAGPIAGVAALSVVLVISGKVVRRADVAVASKQDEARGDWESPPQPRAKDAEAPPALEQFAARPPEANRDLAEPQKKMPHRDEASRKAKVPFAPKPEHAKRAGTNAYDRASRREAHDEDVENGVEGGVPGGVVGAVVGGRLAELPNAYVTSDKQPLREAPAKGAVETKPAPSALGARLSTPSSASAPAAPTADREEEVAKLQRALASGAQGQERARLLRRLCEALDGLNRQREADSACDAVIREFPASDEARSAMERRSIRAAQPRR